MPVALRDVAVVFEYAHEARERREKRQEHPILLLRVAEDVRPVRRLHLRLVECERVTGGVEGPFWQHRLRQDRDSLPGVLLEDRYLGDIDEHDGGAR